jgi:peptidoglycan/LPS O-acetylase OafA/YrhL
MQKTFIMLVILLAVGVGGILLQIFLSKRESKWPGLILPGLTFLWSLMPALYVVSPDGSFPWGTILPVLLMGNIPTLVLLAIYWAAREKRRTKKQVDKTRIDDL